MTNRHWRELVEIVGVVGIIAALVLVASELRDANRISVSLAKMQTELQINDQYNDLNIARASDPNVAKLYPKLEAPEAHLITATDASQIRGIAWHGINNMWSVHSAYKNGLIRRSARDRYIREFAYSLQTLPGITPYYIEIYESLSSIQGVAEYAPIADYIAAQSAVDSP